MSQSTFPLRSNRECSPNQSVLDLGEKGTRGDWIWFFDATVISAVTFLLLDSSEWKLKKQKQKRRFSNGKCWKSILPSTDHWKRVTQKKKTWHPERRKTVPEERSQYLMYLHLRLAVRRTWCRDCSPWAAVENGLAVWANFWGVFWEIAVYSGKWALDSLLRDYCHRYWTWKNPPSLRSHSDLLYSGTAN